MLAPIPLNEDQIRREGEAPAEPELRFHAQISSAGASPSRDSNASFNGIDASPVNNCRSYDQGP